MNAQVKLVAGLLALMPLIGVADDQPKLSCAKDIVYSPEFLAKYPKAPAACREVVMKDGQKWARFDADVVAVEGSSVTANFLDAMNAPIDTLKITATPDTKISIEGNSSKFSSLKPGDKMAVWVPESRLGFYAHPGASTKFAVSQVATQR